MAQYRKVFVCTSCHGVYADEPVTQCDCLPEKRGFREMLIVPPDAVASPTQEPFGYFRSLPFGWEDCKKDDDGAVALYDKPQPNSAADLAFWAGEIDECVSRHDSPIPGTYIVKAEAVEGLCRALDAFRAEQKGKTGDIHALPDDPTPAMVEAAEKVDWSNEDTRGTVYNVWHAMICALRGESK